MLTRTGTLSSLLLASALALPAQVKLTRGQDRVAIEIDGRPFAVFIVGGSGVNRPYLNPLRSASGKAVTRSVPPGELPGESTDHPHQAGLFFGPGDVNGFNYWANLPSPPDPKNGRIVLRDLVSVKSGGQSGTVEALFDWLSPDGKPILTESRKTIFYADPKLRTVDVDLDLPAVEKVVFGDTKEGTFAMRLATALEEAHSGKMVNAQGAVGEKNVWGKRSEWVDYSGVIDGEPLGVAMMDHPGNPRHPTYWHARGYGLLAANPFGLHDFLNDKTQDGSMAVERGNHLRFRYRVIVHPGDHQAARIAELYRKYAGE
jgi:hypothetical protein